MFIKWLYRGKSGVGGLGKDTQKLQISSSKINVMGHLAAIPNHPAASLHPSYRSG